MYMSMCVYEAAALFNKSLETVAPLDITITANDFICVAGVEVCRKKSTRTSGGLFNATDPARHILNVIMWLPCERPRWLRRAVLATSLRCYG